MWPGLTKKAAVIVSDKAKDPQNSMNRMRPYPQVQQHDRFKTVGMTNSPIRIIKPPTTYMVI